MTLAINKYTAKTFIDTPSSGTSVTANDLNRHEVMFSNIYNTLYDTVSDEGWVRVYDNNQESFIDVRKIGPIVYMRWFFASCNGNQWKPNVVLDKKYWPTQGVCFATCCYSMNIDHVGYGYVATDGVMFFNDWYGKGHQSIGTTSWPAG